MSVEATILREMEETSWPQPFTEADRQKNKQFCFDAGKRGAADATTLTMVRLIERYEATVSAALSQAEAEIAKLREALGPFGEIPLFVNSNSSASDGRPFEVADEEALVSVHIKVGDLRRARTATQETE